MSRAFRRFRPEMGVSALAVSGHATDLTFLRDLFGAANWTLHETGSLAGALMLLKRRRVDLVICDRDLPDGDWQAVLGALHESSATLPLIVTSRLADEYLWAEVLNQGGYDVLAQPFDREEVIRVVSAATRHRHNESRRATRNQPLLLRAGA